MKEKSNRLISILLQNEIILKKDIEIYQFGLECFMLKMINYFSYIIFAVIIKRPIDLFIMGISFLPLRRSAGGYHAKTKFGYYLFSSIMVISALLICEKLTIDLVWYIIIVFADITLCIFAPIDNENKKMDTFERQYFRKRTKLLLLMINIICLVTIILRQEIVYRALIAGMFVEAFLLMLVKFRRNNS